MRNEVVRRRSGFNLICPFCRVLWSLISDDDVITGSGPNQKIFIDFRVFGPTEFSSELCFVVRFTGLRFARPYRRPRFTSFFITYLPIGNACREPCLKPSLLLVQYRRPPRVFLDVTWMLNEFLKGALKLLWQVPAFKRSFDESKNLKKLTHCRCWPLGCAQCFNLWIASFLSGTKIESKGDFFHSYFSTMKTKMPNFIILPPPVFGFDPTSH